MTIAMPIAIAIGLAVSLYGQVDRSWPNYQAEQSDKSDQSQDSSKDNSSDDGDKRSSGKGKSGRKRMDSSKDKSAKPEKGPAAGSRVGDSGAKRRE
jgi:hypothetical protein